MSHPDQATGPVPQDSAADFESAEDRPTGPVPQGAPPEEAPPDGGPASSGASPTGHPSASADASAVGEPAAESETPVLGEGVVGGEGEVEEEAEYERLVEDFARLQGERQEYLEQLLRTRADFENYRKRMLKQQTENLERAAEELVGKLLDVLDSFDAAMAHGQGFDQAYRRLMEILNKEGLAPIDPAGAPFDPTEADAVAHEPGDDGPTVSEVFRLGYRWKGRVLRPAMVKVRG